MHNYARKIAKNIKNDAEVKVFLDFWNFFGVTKSNPPVDQPGDTIANYMKEWDASPVDQRKRSMQACDGVRGRLKHSFYCFTG